MREVAITKEFVFSASHSLPSHEGQCRNLHGHNYVLRISARGPVNPIRQQSDDGMVMDFSEVKALYKEQIEPYVEHKHLNDWLDVPTAERLAGQILGILNAHEPRIFRVELWETPTSWVTVEI